MMTTTIDAPWGSLDAPIRLTPGGMKELERRLQLLDDEVLPELRSLALDRDHDERDIAALERALVERTAIQRVLDNCEQIRPGDAADPREAG